jgi:2-(3-amino-3-carboxypropyl)histidine synthase
LTGEALLLGDYELRLGNLPQELSSGRVRKVLVQLPEGLKKYYPKLAEYFRERFQVEVYLDADPVYGSCMVDYSKIGRYDLVLHIGHDPYPLHTYPDRVLFLDLEYVSADLDRLLGSAERVLRSAGVGRLGVATTNQHKKLSELIKRGLEERGYIVEVGPLLILGCYIPRRLGDVEAVLVVSGGRFHPLGVGLALRKVKVFRVDPYTGMVEDVAEDVYKLLKVRLEKMLRAAEARSWGLIAGAAGQYRPAVVEVLERLLRMRGMRYYVYVASVLNIEVLRNIDSPDVEAYVVTSCPRIAIDDLHHFEKPVLTPSEAVSVLKEGALVEYPNDFIPSVGD